MVHISFEPLNHTFVWNGVNWTYCVRFVEAFFFSSVKMETICEQSSANDFFNLKLGTLPFQEELAAQNRHSAKKKFNKSFPPKIKSKGNVWVWYSCLGFSNQYFAAYLVENLFLLSSRIRIPLFSIRLKLSKEIFYFHVLFLESKIQIKTLKHHWRFCYNAKLKEVIHARNVRIKNESNEWAHFFQHFPKTTNETFWTPLLFDSVSKLNFAEFSEFCNGYIISQTYWVI